MRAAFTNNPIGKAYNLEHARIMKREKLVDLNDPNAPFPDANSRKDAIAMVENLQHPVDSRRFKGILAWREGLTVNERSTLNHPTAIRRRWRKDTEPQEEKRARELTREQQEPKEDPMLSLVADTEGERDEARHHAEDLRGLLGRVLDEVEDLPEDLRTAIEQALAGDKPPGAHIEPVPTTRSGAFTQPLAYSLARLKEAAESRLHTSTGISPSLFGVDTQWLRGHEQTVAEITVFPLITGDKAALAAMESTLAALPGVYRVARITGGIFGRNRDLRPQVRALMAMNPVAFERQPLGSGGWSKRDEGVEFRSPA